MKKFIYTLVFFCSSLLAQSQVETIDNIQTSKHIDLPGTKYSMIKPDASFSIATDYTGFQNKDLEAGINITELPMPFDKVLPMFTKDLPPKNGKLVFEKDLIMNGYKGKLYKTDVVHKSTMEMLANPEAKGKPIITWLLIYGNEDLCLTISGRYPSSMDKELSDKFENSLLSFIYLKDKKVDPLAGLTFSIDLDDSPLQFATTLMQTGAAFNMDGKFPTEAEDKTNYMIMVMPLAIEEQNQKERAIRGIKKSSIDNTEVQEINATELDGLKGYEVIGYEKKESGGLVLKYSVTLFDTDRYFIITGTSSYNVEDNLNMFRKISKTFKLRK